MLLYAAVARRAFRRYSTYRAAIAAGVFTQSVFGIIIAYTYLALWSTHSHLGGYDQNQAVTFAWVGQLVLVTSALLGGGFEVEFAERIRTGDIAIDLYRPIDLQAWWMASDLGRAALQFLARGLPPTLIGALIFNLALPSNLWLWPAFLLSLWLGVIVSFAFRYLVALSGFWLLDSRGVSQLSGLVVTFFSGMVLPLTLFPGALGQIATVLPWAAVLQVPADVLLGQRTGIHLLTALLGQLLWALALLAAGQVLTVLANRRLVVQGG